MFRLTAFNSERGDNLETKQVFKVDADGYYVEDVILSRPKGRDGKYPPWDVPDDCVETKPPEGLFQLKWNGTDWEEGLSQTDVDQLRAEIQKQQEDGQAEIYLYETDWYVARYVETQKEIPVDIKDKRAQMREKLSP
jgi:hypothetical protein